LSVFRSLYKKRLIYRVVNKPLFCLIILAKRGTAVSGRVVAYFLQESGKENGF